MCGEAKDKMPEIDEIPKNQTIRRSTKWNARLTRIRDTIAHRNDGAACMETCQHQLSTAITTPTAVTMCKSARNRSCNRSCKATGTKNCLPQNEKTLIILWACIQKAGELTDGQSASHWWHRDMPTWRLSGGWVTMWHAYVYIYIYIYIFIQIYSKSYAITMHWVNMCERANNELCGAHIFNTKDSSNELL